MVNKDKKLNENHINLMEMILAKGDRIEVIPLKDSVRIVRIRREEVKQK